LPDETILSDEFIRELINVGEVDILVGVPTHNDARTVGQVVQGVRAGLLKYFPRARSVIINVMTVFGETKLRVPENWRVIVSGSGILGNFEDKTIPPNTGPDAPTLIIAGFAIFGSVQIED